MSQDHIKVSVETGSLINENFAKNKHCISCAKSNEEVAVMIHMSNFNWICDECIDLVAKYRKDDIVKHYLEAHITIEPVFDEQLEIAATIAKTFGFKMAKLLMQKREADTPERSKYDTFMTGHDKSRSKITDRTAKLVLSLKHAGFKVWRYKIEDTLIDSRIEDEWILLDREEISVGTEGPTS